MHNPWTILLGGDLSGTLPNPSIRTDLAGAAIAAQVFGRKNAPWQPDDDIPLPVFDRHFPHIPEVRAGANVTVTRDALGYLVSSTGGSGSPDTSDGIIAARAFAPRFAPADPVNDQQAVDAMRAILRHQGHVPEVLAGTNVTVTRNALGYTVSSAGGSGITVPQAMAIASLRP